MLKNLARDWSSEGAPERDLCYGPILRELRNHFDESIRAREKGAPPAMVLLPGAGLARLCVEVAGLGLHAQGNEFR